MKRALLALLIGVLPMTSCGGEANAPTTIASERVDSWEAFAARTTQGRPTVVFIGLDGATWDIIDPMVKSGALPAFERLRAQGSFGVLESVDAYVSPPAWTSMMTGCKPGQTGIYSFGTFDWEHLAFQPPRSTDIRVPAVWDVSSFASRASAVINVPLTYPVRPIDGIMVSGLMTPSVLADAQLLSIKFEASRQVPPFVPADSRVFAANANYAGNDLRIYVVGGGDGDDVIIVAQHIDGALEHVGQFAVSTETSPWMRLRHQASEDGDSGWFRLKQQRVGSTSSFALFFSPLFFAIDDSDGDVTYPPSLAGELAEEFGYYFPSVYLPSEMIENFTEDGVRFAEFFRSFADWDLFVYVFTQTDNAQHVDGVTDVTRAVYRRIDAFIGSIIESLPADGHLVIGSDHGFKEYEESLDLNRFLESINLLTYLPDGNVDYNASLVFHNLWCLFFNAQLVNDAELRRRGIKSAGANAHDALVDYIKAQGQRFEHDGASNPLLFFDVDATDDELAPALIVKGTYDSYRVAFWNIMRPSPQLFRPLGANERWHHTREGIYALYGPGVKAGHRGKRAAIEDITPTLLYLLDLPIADNLDGRIIADGLRPAFTEAKPALFMTHYGDIANAPLSQGDDREDLEKKLKSLGYIR